MLSRAPIDGPKARCRTQALLGSRGVEVTSDEPGLHCWDSGLEEDTRAGHAMGSLVAQPISRLSSLMSPPCCKPLAVEHTKLARSIPPGQEAISRHQRGKEDDVEGVRAAAVQGRLGWGGPGGGGLQEQGLHDLCRCDVRCRYIE